MPSWAFKVPVTTAFRRNTCLVLGNLALAAVYFLSARLGLKFALVQGSVSLVWPPSGIALAAVTLGGARWLPGVFAGAFLSNVDPSHSWAFPLASAVGNSAEAWTGAMILRALRFQSALERGRDVLSLSLLAAPAGAMIAAAIGTAALWVEGAVTTPATALIGFHWLLGDIIGMIVVAPVIFTVAAQGLTRSMSWRRALECLLLLGLVTGAGLIFFGRWFVTWPNLTILLVPLLILVAFRFTPREVALASLLIAVTVVIGARDVLGAPASEPLQRKLLSLSMLMLTTNLTAQTLAAVLAALARARAELEERVAERTMNLSRQIEDRIQAEESLRGSERKYRELVENANSIILRMDTDGRVTFFNEFAQNFLGFTEREIVGRSVIGTIVPQTESSGRDLVKLIHDLSEHPELHLHNENENLRRNGQRVWIAWTNKPVYDASGHMRELLCIGNDITELKLAEHSLRTANGALAQANDQLAAADRLKSAFLATMSHELRTPLNSIIGFTGIMLQGLAGPLNDEQQKQMGMVQGSARHLLALINDVLDISKIEAGQLEVRREPFDLRRSIEKVLEVVRPLAQRNGLTLRDQVSIGDGPVVSDQRRVEQVLTNLLGNAIKFTEQGEVCVTCVAQGGWLTICVHDTGIGIQQEHLGDIFKPFLQIDCGVTRKHEGTGLGLSICKRLVELLGGSICVESQFGAGSTFIFTLPLFPGGNS